MRISRRKMFAATATALGAVAGVARAAVPAAPYKLESDRQDVRTFHEYHQGLGSIGMRIFDFGGASAPAHFLTFDIPSGASEGVHVHNLTDPKLGPYDEYYYIVEGRGEMMIDGKAVPVTAGDHVHAPLEVPHGIRNTDPVQPLKVFLTYINRSVKA